MNKICITGACGFIGKNLVKKLNEKGFFDLILIDWGKKEIDKELKYKQYIDYQTLFKSKVEFPEIDFIFHLGANTLKIDEESNLIEKNLVPTLQLSLFSGNFEIPIVFASSKEVYGPVRLESDEVNPNNFFGVTKAIGEEMVKKLNDKYVALRYHNVYGHNESKINSSLIYKWLFEKNENFNLYENSNNILRDFIYVDDVNEINLFMYEYYSVHKQFPFTYTDVGTGKPVTLKKVVDELNKYKKIEINYIKNPYEIVNSKCAFQFYTEADIKILKKEYKKFYNKDFEPIQIEQGIKKICKNYDYFRNLQNAI